MKASLAIAMITVIIGQTFAAIGVPLADFFGSECHFTKIVADNKRAVKKRSA